MKLNSYAVLLLTITLMSNYVYSACLTADQYTSLGITGAGELVDNLTGDEAKCKSFTKVCIDPSKIEEVIGSAGKEIKKLIGGQGKLIANFMKKAGKRMKKAADKMATKDGSGKRKNKEEIEKKHGVTISEEAIAAMEKFKEKCDGEDCENLVRTEEEIAQQQKCRNEISKLVVGSYCYILSENGSEAIVTDASGVITGLNINQENAQAVFNECLGLFQENCEFMMTVDTLVMLGNGKGKGKGLEKKAKMEKISNACESIKESYDCVDAPEKCAVDLVNKFVSSFISIGAETGIGPDEEVLNEAETEVPEDDIVDGGTETEDSATETKDNTKETTRRILEATSTCYMEGSKSGVDVAAYGSNSGIDYSGWESVSIKSILVFLVFLKIYIK